MPLYDYQCRACSKVTEVRHGFREAYDGTCPECGGALARVFSPAGILFKGPGFYITDSRKAAGSNSGSAETSSKPAETGSKPAETSSPSGETAAKPSEAVAKPSDTGSKKSESSAA